jgi:hypothetical protein
MLLDIPNNEFQPKTLQPPVGFFDSKFKFIFYMSFASKSESVGV